MKYTYNVKPFAITDLNNHLFESFTVHFLFHNQLENFLDIIELQFSTHNYAFVEMAMSKTTNMTGVSLTYNFSSVLWESKKTKTSVSTLPLSKNLIKTQQDKPGTDFKKRLSPSVGGLVH